MTDQDPTRTTDPIPDPDAPTAATPPGPVSYEPADRLAPAEPVIRPSSSRKGGRGRWAAAIAVVALVIAASAVIAALITGRSPDATVLGYVPEGTIMYGEVRLDLPGDQRRAVGEFLSKFPGFADQATLETKLDEALDELIKGATNGDQTYTANIKPWFEGELAFSSGALPPAASMADDPAAMDKLRLLVLLSIKDQAGAQAWFDGVVTKRGAKTTSETYKGVTLTLVDEPAMGPKGAFAIVGGKVAVVGDVTSVKAAIDTNGQGGFAREPDPKTALGSANGDHVGFVYVALGPLLDWTTKVGSLMSTGASPAPAISSLTSYVPDWGAYWLRVERDAIVLDAVAPKAATALGPTEDRTSTVAEHIPASAVVAAISHDFGATLKQMLGIYKAEPSLKPMIDQLETGLGVLGGPDAAVGWIGDTAIVINDSAGTPEGGLVALPTDKAVAERLFTTLRSFIAFGGAQQGITVREEAYAGTTIVIVEIGDIAALTGLGSAGASPTVPMPAGSLTIAYAVTGDIVVVGSGPDFVKHVLDTTKASSIASSDRYKSLVDRAGKGTGSTFVDITAVRGLIENALAAADPTGQMATYESDVKPYLVPFDALVASGSVGGDLTGSTIIITVK